MKLTYRVPLSRTTLAFFLLLLSPATAFGASPASGDITPTSAPLAWSGTAPGGACANEGTCVEGVNCDSFVINVGGASADWAGRLVSVRLDWTVPANDYDLYIHKDSVTGPLVGDSGNGAPTIGEDAAIDPSATGTGTYVVNVLYFAVTPLVDQYRATATVMAKPNARTANYLKGGMTFSPNWPTTAPGTVRDGEPSSRTDKFGNHYVAGIRGVPAGVDLWYFDLRPGSPTYDPFMRNPIYRGQPDSFTSDQSTAVGADGGGDVDLAVGFDSPDGVNAPILASSSLVAANISTQRSTNRGSTFDKNPIGNVTGGLPGDDRQWLEFFGSRSVYLLYRTLAPAVTQIQRSNDGGLTYGPAVTAGAIGQVGSIDVDQRDGTVYISGSSGQVCVGTPTIPGAEPLVYNCTQAANDPSGVAHIFFLVKVADDGTAYVCYSNDHDIYLSHSTDKGKTWSLPVRVSDGPETRTSVFPAIETGPVPGSVGIAWYGTTEATNNDNANWQVFYAQTMNAKEQTPTFRQVVASDHFIHGSNISEGGTLGNANRNLIDYFQISFDPTGAAIIDYTDDHNDFDGATFVTRQISGPGVKGTSIPAPVEGSALPPRPTPPADGSQVTDFAQDVTDGLVVQVAKNDPMDIVSIRYSCETGADGAPVIVATMKVSDLSTLPALGNWRASFAANALDSRMSPTGLYTFGVSDRGDQFWMRASSDAAGVMSYSYGTAVRNPDGTITYTEAGAADGGSVDQQNGTITMKVSTTKLNPLVRSGNAPIGVGSTLVGLRGAAYHVTVEGRTARRDQTRGGTQFTIGTCGADSGGNGGGHGNPGPIVKSTGAGSIDGKVRSFRFQVDSSLAGQLSYRDSMESLELVSTKITSFAQTGAKQVTFSGTGTVGRDPVTFEVTVDDNGGPGTGDFFKITINGARNSIHSGNLSQGNVQVHR